MFREYLFGAFQRFFSPDARFESFDAEFRSSPGSRRPEEIYRLGRRTSRDLGPVQLRGRADPLPGAMQPLSEEVDLSGLEGKIRAGAVHGDGRQGQGESDRRLKGERPSSSL